MTHLYLYLLPPPITGKAHGRASPNDGGALLLLHRAPRTLVTSLCIGLSVRCDSCHRSSDLDAASSTISGLLGALRQPLASLHITQSLLHSGERKAQLGRNSMTEWPTVAVVPGE